MWEEKWSISRETHIGQKFIQKLEDISARYHGWEFYTLIRQPDFKSYWHRLITNFTIKCTISKNDLNSLEIWQSFPPFLLFTMKIIYSGHTF